MRSPKYFTFIIGLWILGLQLLSGYDVPGFVPDQIVEYKQATDSSGGPVSLNLEIFKPAGHSASDRRAAIVFFFGGAWNTGSPSQFHPHCKYLASRGMIAISAEYRINELHGTTPRECVYDGKSAVRWIRENASTLGIDPNRIAASGGSAGGHIAAATGTLSAFEEPGENLLVSSKPNALVLFNPVYDNGPTGYANNRVADYWEDFSPLHNLDATTPQTVVFLGTSDNLIPVVTALNYQAILKADGVRSDLHLYQDQPHGFFNYEVPGDGSGPWLGYQATVFRMDEFLVSLGYLSEANRPNTNVTGWTSIFGDAGFAEGSSLTGSPVTTGADGDSIAANISSMSLGDGEHLRLTGSVSIDAPLSGGNFRLGLFNGDDPVTAGDGSGYAGIWAEAPGTGASNIANGDGTGSDHPFETASASILGTVPGSSGTVPANTKIDFSLMISRVGSSVDVTVDFTDGGSYRQSQNLLNLPLSVWDFNSVAFLMTENLNATSASFENVRMTTGPVLPTIDPVGEPISRMITYLDAVEGPSGNTFATGGLQSNTSWLVDPGSASVDEDQWGKRPFGNGETLFQAMHNLPDEMPELTTKITGLSDGTYEIWAFYWDQVDSDAQNWTLSTGLTPGSLQTYSSPGEPAVVGATTVNVFNATGLDFINDPLVVDGGGLRNLFGVNLGRVTVAGGSAVSVYVDNLIGTGSVGRTWYDGVGYSQVNDFSAWISKYDLGGEDAFDDDPDGDGNVNGLEGFFGTDPGVSNSAGLITGASSPASPTTFVLQHPQNPIPLEDFSAAYVWSTGLETFFADGASNGEGTTVNFSSSPNTPSPGITTVTATLGGPVVPELFFVRLNLTKVEP